MAEYFERELKDLLAEFDKQDKREFALMDKLCDADAYTVRLTELTDECIKKIAQAVVNELRGRDIPCSEKEADNG